MSLFSSYDSRWKHIENNPSQDFFSLVLLGQRLTSCTHIPSEITIFPGFPSTTGGCVYYTERTTEGILTHLGFKIRGTIKDLFRATFPKGWRIKLYNQHSSSIFNASLFPQNTIAFLMDNSKVLRGVITEKQKLLLYPRFFTIITPSIDTSIAFPRLIKATLHDLELNKQYNLGELSIPKTEDLGFIQSFVREVERQVGIHLPEYKDLISYWGKDVKIYWE